MMMKSSNMMLKLFKPCQPSFIFACKARNIISNRPPPQHLQVWNFKYGTRPPVTGIGDARIVIAGITAIAASISAIGFWTYFGTQEYQLSRAVKRLEKLGKAKKYESPPFFVSQESKQQDFLVQAIKLNQKSGLTRTVVVIGARGIGKTTLVKEALQDEKGVMFVPSCTTVDGVCMSVLTDLGVTNLKVTPTSGFQHIVWNAKKKPVFVVEVDEEWTPEEVTSLMILAKRMGDDGTFVVVLSEALSFLSVMDFLVELRGVPFVLEDISKEVKWKYFDLIFDSYLDQGSDVEGKNKKEEKNELVEYTIENAGNTFLYLGDLLRHIRFEKGDKKFTAEEWKKTVNFKRSKSITDMGEAFVSLLRRMNVKELNEAQKKFLTDLALGKVFHMWDFYGCFGQNPEEFFEVYKNIRPHPLHISIGSHVYVNDPFAKIALKKLVESGTF